MLPIGDIISVNAKPSSDDIYLEGMNKMMLKHLSDLSDEDTKLYFN